MRAALLSTISLIVVSCGYTAFADDQYQGHDVDAQLNLSVDDAHDVAGAAVAGSNSYTSTATGASINADGVQHSEGVARADTNATIWNAHDDVILSSTATGNGTTVAADGGSIVLDRRQVMNNDAQASVFVQTGNVGGSYSSASAASNVTTLAAQNGDINAALVQRGGGAVNARVEADLCCVGWTASADAVASVNSISASGSTTTALISADQNSYATSINADVDLYVGYAGDAVGAASASANSLVVDNQWGYVNASAVQRNWSDATATSYVTLGGDFLGQASASAYGVGNSAAVSNIGSDTVMDVGQSNEAAISAYAALAGQGGEEAIVSSAAYGNVITGSLCVTCSSDGAPSLNAQSSQFNTGPVRASSTIQTPGARNVSGSAVAIGNAASYSVNGR